MGDEYEQDAPNKGEFIESECEFDYNVKISNITPPNPAEGFDKVYVVYDGDEVREFSCEPDYAMVERERLEGAKMLAEFELRSNEIRQFIKSEYTKWAKL